MEVPQLSKQDPGSLHQQEGLMRTSHRDGQERYVHGSLGLLLCFSRAQRQGVQHTVVSHSMTKKKKKKHIAPMEAFTEAES